MAKKKTCIVKIYGEIRQYGDNSAAAFIERFDEARKGADEMVIYLHTQGGDVLEGTLIYNHLKACDIPVTIHITGVSCSMGTVIMMGAGKVYMCENSYLMVHAPQGGCYGTATEMEKVAKGLRGMEKNFKKIYAAKMGKNEKQMDELLVGDNWYTAQEALEAKLIDGIVAPIATDVTLSAEDVKGQSPTALYNRFSACLKAGQERGNSINNNNKNEMDKESLIKRFGLTGVTAQSTDAEIEAALQAKLDAEKQRADDAESANATAEKKRITDMVEAAVDEKKITAEQKALYTGIGEKSGYETLASLLAGMKPTPSLVNITRGGASAAAAVATSRADWNWEKWQKEDPRGLEAMAKTEPEKFQAIYAAEFGK